MNKFKIDPFGLWPSIHDEESLIRQAIQIIESRLVKGEKFTSSGVVRQYCQLQLANDPEESFCCLFLNNQHYLIRFERLFMGTIDSASVHPRVVVRRAIELNAAAVVFTHNHPSGVCEPSQADISITKRLKDTLSLIDVNVLDHIVVSAGGSHSMAENGQM